MLLVACMITAVSSAPAESGSDLSLLAINVGKADCLLLRYGGLNYLIDTGTAASWGAVSAALRANGVTRLDGVILTHTDKDHAGGLDALAASAVEVGTWYASAEYCEVTEKKHPAVLAAARRGQSVVWLREGDRLPFGDGRLTVIGPIAHFFDSENNNSAVLLAEAAGGRMLLCGDMEQPAENMLLSVRLVPECDVLKVGHHGEGDATGEAFARAVMPKVAVISTDSVAEPDTPSRRVMKLLRGLGAQIALTEETEGGVLVTISGGQTRCEAAAWDMPAAVAGVRIAAKDNGADTVTLRNGGAEPADLSGWFLFSERGGETYVFAEGTVLAPGGELTVGPGGLAWDEKNVWHDKKDDTAVLYDAWGREMDRAE